MAPAKTRQRGMIGWLPSGSARVKVYAGIDQLTGEKMWLRETVAARATRRETEKVRRRLLNQVDERRSQIEAFWSFSEDQDATDRLGSA